MGLPQLTGAEREARRLELHELREQEAGHRTAIQAFTSLLEEAEQELLRSSAANEDLLDVRHRVATTRVCKAKHQVDQDHVQAKIDHVDLELRTGRKMPRSWPEPALKSRVESEAEFHKDARIVSANTSDRGIADDASDDSSCRIVDDTSDDSSCRIVDDLSDDASDRGTTIKSSAVSNLFVNSDTTLDVDITTSAEGSSLAFRTTPTTSSKDVSENSLSIKLNIKAKNKLESGCG
ncbi:hypothetical protein NLU13_4274 [Sarocladium strictum]|uniref:Uncharacterized protein n=1 Tax=Sarocladium strictum TaxID=5046 RepID=A0AA39GIJ7_SARSR|nr:hypothetical protein NLU13_4274 [Sarocladium strictum]